LESANKVQVVVADFGENAISRLQSQEAVLLDKFKNALENDLIKVKLRPELVDPSLEPIREKVVKVAVDLINSLNRPVACFEIRNEIKMKHAELASELANFVSDFVLSALQGAPQLVEVEKAGEDQRISRIRFGLLGVDYD
jgi:hypothetical protein